MVHCGSLSVCLVVVLMASGWCDEEYVQEMDQSHGDHHMDRSGPKVPHMMDDEHNPHYDHQSILGSEDMDEEFDSLPEPEARVRLEKMVKGHDLNKDGLITKEELTKWIQESYKKLDREEAREKFTEEDKDQDGKVTWKEYLDKVYSFTSEDVDAMEQAASSEHSDTSDDARDAKSNLKMVKDDDDFFKAADVNKDGALDSEEYLAFFFPPNHKHMHQVEMDHFMRDHDTNKDGKISVAEFEPEHADRESRIVQEENFAGLDKDKDGHLTREEALEWVVPKTDELVEDEVQHLLTMADTNGDGKLAMKEILDKTKEFVGSAITDYGNFMHEEL